MLLSNPPSRLQINIIHRLGSQSARLLASAKDAVSSPVKRLRHIALKLKSALCYIYLQRGTVLGAESKKTRALLARLEYAEYVDWLREQGSDAFAAKLKLALCSPAALVLKSKSAQRRAA